MPKPDAFYVCIPFSLRSAANTAARRIEKQLHYATHLRPVYRTLDGEDIRARIELDLYEEEE